MCFLKFFLLILGILAQLLTPSLSSAAAVPGARRSLPDFYEDYSPTAVRRTAIQSGVSVALRVATERDLDLGQIALQGLSTAVASGIATLGAQAIGDLYQVGDISEGARAALHGALGFALGAASDLRDPLRGGAGGAIGAVAGEMVAPMLPQDWNKDVRVGLAALTGAVVAFGAGQDPIAASLAATNAAENNQLAHETYHPLNDEDRELYEAQMQGAQQVIGESWGWLTEPLPDHVAGRERDIRVAQARFRALMRRGADMETADARLATAYNRPVNRLGIGLEMVDVGGVLLPAVRTGVRAALQGVRAAVQMAGAGARLVLPGTRAGIQLAEVAARSAAPMVGAPVVSLFASGQEVVQTLRFPSLRFANAMAGEARVVGSEVAPFRGLASEARAAAPLQQRKVFDIRKQLSDPTLVGEYRRVRGHHVHAKKAFEGHLNYDPRTGFSISEELMDSVGIKHRRVTTAQQRLFTELAKSGRPNTLREHTRIAVEALVEGGASREQARSIVARSLQDLRNKQVREPRNIPWASQKTQ